MEKTLDPVNLKMAWKRVKSNKGAPGVDGMTIAAFPEFHRNHWTRIESDLWKGADDFLVMVRSARAAQRVMASLVGFVEGPLKLVVNRIKSRTAPLKCCAFLGFTLNGRGQAKWSDKDTKGSNNASWKLPGATAGMRSARIELFRAHRHSHSKPREGDASAEPTFP